LSQTGFNDLLNHLLFQYLVEDCDFINKALPSLVVDGPAGPFLCAALGTTALPFLHAHPAGHQVAVKQL